MPLELNKLTGMCKFSFLQIVKLKFSSKKKKKEKLEQHDSMLWLKFQRWQFFQSQQGCKTNHIRWQLSLNPSLEASLLPSPGRKHRNLWKQTVCCLTCTAPFSTLATTHGQCE